MKYSCSVVAFVCFFLVAAFGEEVVRKVPDLRAYKNIDWEDLRKGPEATQKGIIDGFLRIEKKSGNTYEIMLFESLEALEFDRPRRQLIISQENFTVPLSDEMRKAGLLDFHKRWVRLAGVFKVASPQENWILAEIAECDFIQWMGKDGKYVTEIR